MKGAIFLATIIASIMLVIACRSNSAAKVGDLTVTLSPRVLNTGDNKVDISIVDARGSPVTEVAVKCELMHRSMQMEKNVVLCDHEGSGHYTAMLTPNMAGSWSVFVEVQRDDQSLGRAEFGVIVKDGDALAIPHVH